MQTRAACRKLSPGPPRRRHVRVPVPLAVDELQEGPRLPAAVVAAAEEEHGAVARHGGGGFPRVPLRVLPALARLGVVPGGCASLPERAEGRLGERRQWNKKKRAERLAEKGLQCKIAYVSGGP